MPTIKDVSIIDSNKAKAVAVKSGFERVICSPSVCGSKNLTVYRRTVTKGKQLDAGIPRPGAFRGGICQPPVEPRAGDLLKCNPDLQFGDMVTVTGIGRILRWL